MPPYKEKEIKILFYTIGEVSKILNVNVSLVRFWDNEFDIIKPKKNKKGNRLFSEKDLKNLKMYITRKYLLIVHILNIDFCVQSKT